MAIGLGCRGGGKGLLAFGVGRFIKLAPSVYRKAMFVSYSQIQQVRFFRRIFHGSKPYYFLTFFSNFKRLSLINSGCVGGFVFELLLLRQYKDLKPAQQRLHHPIRSQRSSGRFRADRLILTFDGFWFAIPALTFVLVL